MNFYCRFNEKVLSRLALRSTELPPAGRVSDHLARCPDCSQTWRELRRTREAIASIRAAEPLSSDFSEEVWRRIEAAEKANRRDSSIQRMVPAAFSLAAVVLVVAALCARPPATDGTAALRRISAAPVVHVAARLTPKEGEAAGSKQPRPTTDVTQLGRAAERKHSARRRPVRYAPHQAKKLFRKRKPVLARSAVVVASADVLTTKAPPNTRTQWERWGVWYELWGDQRAATAAYAKAFEETPSPGLAYTAGRAAESAGDLSTAVDYYVKALDSTNHKDEEPKKGSFRCQDDHTSA